METKKIEFSSKAKEAEIKSIENQYSEDIKAAAEAMKRTNRVKRTQVVHSRQYVYKQVF